MYITVEFKKKMKSGIEVSAEMQSPQLISESITRIEESLNSKYARLGHSAGKAIALRESWTGGEH